MEQAQEALYDDMIDQPMETEEAEPESLETEDMEVSDDEMEAEEIFIDVDYEGKTYNVPEELKDALLRQSDYTKKTTEVSEQRQALEQAQRDFQQAQQIQQLNMQGHAQLMALQSQLEQYNSVDWGRYSEDNPSEAQQAFFQYNQLKDATQTLATQLQQQENAVLQDQQLKLARQMENTQTELARDVPGWTEDLRKTLVDYGSSMGYTKEQVEYASKTDPAAMKVLRKAQLYDQLKQQAKTPQSKTVKPTSRVKGRGKAQKDPEKMTDAEWLAWRNKQLYGG